MRTPLTACVLIACGLLGLDAYKWEKDEDESSSWISVLHELDLDSFLDDASLALGLTEEILAADAEIEWDLEGLQQNCGQCRSVIGIAKALVRNGTTFEDVRDLSITICIPIAEAQGYNGTFICPAIVDNFGPEVVYVLNATNDIYTANEICTIYRQCGEDLIATKQQDTASIWRPKAQPVKSQRSQISQRDYSQSVKAVHITDIHVDLHYKQGEAPLCNLPLCCREGLKGEGISEYWGDYECGVPTHTVESFLRQLKRDYDPDMIFYTGDSPPHAIWLETQWGQLNDSRYVTEILGQIFPDIPSYTALGNHDTFPVNVYGRERPDLLTEELNEVLTDYWAPISRFGPEQMESFRFGAFFSIEIMPGLRCISYNSEYGITDNTFILVPYSNEEHEVQVEFLKTEMQKARDSGERVVLLGHHLNGGRSRLLYWETFMYELTRDYGDVIILHLDGHAHTDRFQMTIDRDTGELRNTWISSPTMGTKSHKNPSARIFYLDPDTLLPLDFDNVYFNLTEALEVDPDAEEPELKVMYRASEEYGMPDLSPQSWLEFVDRMYDDDDLFYQYYWNRETRVGDWPSRCEDECRHRRICGLKTVVARDEDECREAYP